MLSANTTTFDARYAEKRSRLTTFFRLLLVIPHMIVLAVYGFVATFAVIIAWFALVFAARYPQGLYDFVAGYARYSGRVTGYYYLLTDVYPPFSGKDDSEYPVQLAIGPPMEKYSRLLAFFRIILLIPVSIIAYVLMLVAGLMTFVAWFVVVIVGRMPEGLQRIIEFGVSYQVRANVYGLLLTEAFPAFDGSSAAVTGATPEAPSSDEPPVPPATVDGIGDPPR